MERLSREVHVYPGDGSVIERVHAFSIPYGECERRVIIALNLNVNAGEHVELRPALHVPLVDRVGA